MQNWKNGCVFGHSDTFWKGHDRQIKKNACKNTYLGSIFIPEIYVFRVCFESPFTRMISSLKYKCPPPPGHTCNMVIKVKCQLRVRFKAVSHTARLQRIQKLCCRACHTNAFFWTHYSCTSQIALVASKIPNHVQDPDFNLQMYSWSSSNLSPRTHTGIQTLS